ncbi:MAG: response regulator with CheY-like receiver domain and winged-helix DNA-binding domain [Verrucomicrobiales bacterium]|nr:response regulator with CheY-like receiver domain and winged-helix DNA-binding domain [Verrucomicrobiales bacterium]
MSDKRSVFLLAEDNEDDVFFMQRAFRDAGLGNLLFVVTNGEEAVDYLAGREAFSDRNKYPLPDMVFLDLKMPGLNGFEVLSWVRQEGKLTMPVAVLTSSPEEIDLQRARSLGADCYLLKPPTAAMLQSCCQQFRLQCS